MAAKQVARNGEGGERDFQVYLSSTTVGSLPAFSCGNSMTDQWADRIEERLVATVREVLADHVATFGEQLNQLRAELSSALARRSTSPSRGGSAAAPSSSTTPSVVAVRAPAWPSAAFQPVVMSEERPAQPPTPSRPTTPLRTRHRDLEQLERQLALELLALGSWAGGPQDSSTAPLPSGRGPVLSVAPSEATGASQPSAWPTGFYMPSDGTGTESVKEGGDEGCRGNFPADGSEGSLGGFMRPVPSSSGGRSLPAQLQRTDSSPRCQAFAVLPELSGTPDPTKSLPTSAKLGRQISPSFSASLSAGVEMGRVGTLVTAACNVAGSLRRQLGLHGRGPVKVERLRQMCERELVLGGGLGHEEASELVSLQSRTAARHRLAGCLGRVSVFLCPRICGALPWRRCWRWLALCYQAGILCLAATAFLFHLIHWVPAWQGAVEGGPGLISDLGLAVGGCLALASCGSLWRNTLVRCDDLMAGYAETNGFRDDWMSCCSTDSLALLVVWLASTSLRFALAAGGGMGAELKWAAIFAFTSGLLLALATYVLHTCRFLLGVVDTFCCGFVECPQVEVAVRKWNVLQAAVRKISGAVQRAVFALLATAFGVAILCGADASRFPGRLLGTAPAALVALGLVRIFFLAAAVTEKCARAPVFLNSLVLREGIDPAKMYLVEHISHSKAGFYIFEVCLTSSMALKYCYFCFAAAYAMATKVIGWQWAAM